MTPPEFAVPGPRLQQTTRHFIVLSLVLISLALSAAPALAAVDTGPTPATGKDFYHNNTLLFWSVLLVLIWLKQEPRVVERRDARRGQSSSPTEAPSSAMT